MTTTLAFFFALISVLPGGFASAATFWVDRVDDKADTSPGDGRCEVVGGGCCVRAAVQEANALPGLDRIFLPAGRYTLTLTGSNEDSGATGDLDVLEDLVVRGAGRAVTAIVAESLSDRVLQLHPGVALRAYDLAFTGGDPPLIGGNGGCLLSSGDLEVDRVTISGCTGREGGCVYASGRAVIRSSFLSGCTARDSAGGGIYANGSVTVAGSTIQNNIAFGPSNDGGAIFNAPLGDLTVVGSVLAFNEADVGGAIANSGTLRLLNSTLAENEATEGARGLLLSKGPVRIEHSTLVDSEIEIFTGDASLVTMANTILKSPLACPHGTLTSLGGNVESSDSCGLAQFSDQPATDPMLGPLVSTGGTTSWYELLPGSPAIGGGTPARCAALDQRFFARAAIGDCDSGAVEFQALPPCGDGIDNDSDGTVDLADRGCSNTLDPTEVEFEAGAAFLNDSLKALYLRPSAGGTPPSLFGRRPLGIGALAVAADGRIVAVDEATGSVLEYDPRWNAHFGMARMSADQLVSTPGIAFEADGALVANVIDLGASRVVRVSADGLAVTLSEPGDFQTLRGIGVSPRDGRLFVSEENASQGDRVWRIDPQTGARTAVASQPDIDGPMGLAVEANGNVLVTSSGDARLVRAQPEPGPASTVATFLFGDFPVDVEVEANGDALVADADLSGLRRVNTTNGSFVELDIDPIDVPGFVAVIPESADVDGDGVPARFDVCPDVYDPSQRDDGGIATALVPDGSLIDGYGNACACGDANASHALDPDDVDRIRQALVGSTTLVFPGMCNTVGPIDALDRDGDGVRDDCNIADAVVLIRVLAMLPMPEIARDACEGRPAP